MENSNGNGIKSVNGSSDNKNIFTELQHIDAKLEQFRNHFEKELNRKQQVLQRQMADIDKLKSEIDRKNSVIRNLENQLQEYMHHVEGNRQLINKLLNDIGHYQNDIEWYKRTYEKRSIWGVLKDKISKKK